MTKKQRILKMFNGIDWIEHSDPEWPYVKLIHTEDLKANDLSTTIEYQEKWTDIHYLKRVLKKEGFRVLIGAYCIYVQTKKLPTNH